MNNSFEERRKYLRIYRNFILSYSEKGESEISFDVSQVNNISRGGINFSSKHTFKEGTILNIDLRTPFIADAIHMEGVVLECKEKVPDLIYEIRVQFHDVSDQSLDILEKIENYGKDEKDKN